MEFTPESTRSATRLGGVLLAILAAGLIGMLATAGVQWRTMRSWSVFGSFEEGFRGIRQGSAVRVGGVVMGHVTQVEFDPHVQPRPPEESGEGADVEHGRLLVTFDLEASIELRAGARIVHDVNPISGIGELDIINVGTTRAVALPGRIGRSAMLAPVQPEGRPFSLTVRRPAIVTILGAESARQWERISHTIDSVRGMFLAESSLVDPASGEMWGPNEPGSATALHHAMQDVRARISNDLGPWRERIDSIRAGVHAMRDQFADARAKDGERPSLVSRLDELRSSFGSEGGLRGIGAQMQPLFDKVFDNRGRLQATIHQSLDTAKGIAQLMRDLWPELIDDLRVTRAGFSIVASEVWLALGPDMWTTASRIFWPLSRRDREGFQLIYGANRVAMSAEALRAAVEAAQAVDKTSGAAGREIPPAVREQLVRQVADALQRYRRDLADFMTMLETFADPR